MLMHFMLVLSTGPSYLDLRIDGFAGFNLILGENYIKYVHNHSMLEYEKSIYLDKNRFGLK